MSSAYRRAEVERLRREGYEAAMAGKPHNPYLQYNTMDQHQWYNGYEEGMRDLAIANGDLE